MARNRVPVAAPRVARGKAYIFGADFRPFINKSKSESPSSLTRLSQRGVPMNHFDISKWADFVRGLIEESAQVAMKRHLASGCRKCRRITDLLHNVEAATRSDSQVHVPKYAVRCARVFFLLQQPEKVQILTRIPTQLLYDSFREPLPAGLRTRQRLSRQYLYQAGDYSLDLRLENERGSSRVALVGQIQNLKQAGKRLGGGVPVLLVSGKKILARAVSNSLGEFQMEYAPQKHQRLYVPVHRSGKRVRVFLNKLRTEKTAVGKATEEIPSSKKGPILC